MKRYGVMTAVLVLLSVLLAGSWAWAADKMGFVNIQEVMTTSNAGKKELEDLKKSVEKTKGILKERESELSKLKDELEKQKPLLKEDVLKEKEFAYQKKFRDYQNLVKDSNEELQVREQEILKKLVPEIQKVIQSIGEKEKYSMIIDAGQLPIVFYHSKENDLTKRVVEEFNKTYKSKK